LWHSYKEDASPDATKLARELTNSPSPTKVSGSGRASADNTPAATSDEMMEKEPDGNFITPAFLITVLQKMREARFMDHARASGRPVAINKRLERTQAVG